MKPYGLEIKPRVPRPKAPRPRYQWPANKITPDEVAILFRLRENTGTPINQLIQEAIRKLGEAIPVQSTTAPSESAASTYIVK